METEEKYGDMPEFFHGYCDNDPKEADWPLAENPYPESSESWSAYNAGWNTRSAERDERDERISNV